MRRRHARRCLRVSRRSPTRSRADTASSSALNDHSTSQRQQYAGGLTLYAGDHEIKAGGDYQDGRTDAFGLLHGRPARLHPKRVRASSTTRTRFFAREPRRPDGRSEPTAQRAGPGLRRLPAGLLEGRAGSDGQPGPALGRRADARLRGSDRPALQRPVAAARRRGLGPLAERRDEGLCLRRPLLLRACRPPRPLCRSVERHESRHLQLRSCQRDAGSGRVRPRRRQTAEAEPSETRSIPDVRGWYQDELTVGIERLSAPTLTVGLKGTYRTLRNVLEDRCDLDYNVPETDYSSCGLMNPGSSGAISRAATFRLATGSMTTRTSAAYEPGPATPPSSRIYRGIELLARKSVGTTPLAPGELRLLVPARQLRRRRQPERLRPDLARRSTRTSTIRRCAHNAYGALALDRPHRFRFDGYWVSPWRLSARPPGVCGVGRAAQPAGLLQRGSRRRHLSSIRAVPPVGCRRSGGPTSHSRIRSRSARRP